MATVLRYHLDFFASLALELVSLRTVRPISTNMILFDNVLAIYKKHKNMYFQFLMTLIYNLRACFMISMALILMSIKIHFYSLLWSIIIPLIFRLQEEISLKLARCPAGNIRHERGLTLTNYLLLAVISYETTSILL